MLDYKSALLTLKTINCSHRNFQL